MNELSIVILSTIFSGKKVQWERRTRRMDQLTIFEPSSGTASSPLIQPTRSESSPSKVGSNASRRRKSKSKRSRIKLGVLDFGLGTCESAVKVTHARAKPLAESQAPRPWTEHRPWRLAKKRGSSTRVQGAPCSNRRSTSCQTQFTRSACATSPHVTAADRT